MSKIMIFREVTSNDTQLVGFKGVNIAKLAASFKVPEGFIVTVKTYEEFLKKTEIEEKIKNYLKRMNHENVQDIANKIQKTIVETHIPANISNDILEAYESLSFDKKFTADDLLENKDEAYVSVRSSYIEEHEGKDLSQLTFLNIKGERRLLTAIKVCWAAQYTAKNIMARKKLSLEKDAMNAVIIQKMIQSDVSIIGYSSNPNNKNDDEIYIKAILGLGEGFTIGDVSYDGYVINKENLTIKEVLISEQSHKHALDTRISRTGKVMLKEFGKKQKLNDNDIREASRLTKKIASFIGRPQKIEIALKGNDFFILQSKDIEKRQVKEDVELAFGKVEIHTPEEDTEDKIVIDVGTVEKNEEETSVEKEVKKMPEDENVLGANEENEIDFSISEKKDLDDDLDLLQKLEFEASKFQTPLKKKIDEPEEDENILKPSEKDVKVEVYDQTDDLKKGFMDIEETDDDENKVNLFETYNEDENQDEDEIVEDDPENDYDDSFDEVEEQKDDDDEDDSIFSSYRKD